MFSEPVPSKWVLITGASYGIGEAFAKRFAREKYNLILVARSAERLNELAKTLTQGHSIETFVVASDLTDRLGPRMVYDEVARKGIVIAGLINNAGFGGGRKFPESELDLYLRMIDLNIRAVVELTHLFIVDMIKRKNGFIINVSSTASYQPLPCSAVYAASKSFVTSFTEALWLETKGTGVRVLNLCPGLTKTDFGIRAKLRDFHKDPFAEEPKEVVETAFRGLGRNTPTVISGFRNRLIVLFMRLLPHRFLLWLVFVFQNTRRRV